MIVRRSHVVYPFLFAVYPILFLYSHNVGEVSVTHVFLPFLISLTGSSKAGVATTLIVMSFFLYGHVLEYLVLTVPFATSGETREHFPDLNEFRIEKSAGRKILVNRTCDGDEQRFENPVFHGGSGLTLEMRQFSQSGLLDEVNVPAFGRSRSVATTT